MNLEIREIGWWTQTENLKPKAKKSKTKNQKPKTKNQKPNIKNLKPQINNFSFAQKKLQI